MTDIREIARYADELLEVGRFADYCPNGLQVEGGRPVRLLASGVTASRAFIEAAIDQGADALLVHHGYFWKGEDARITGMKRERLRLLLAHDVSLLAYHLPLDAHPELGNNAQLAARLGFSVEGVLREDGIGLVGSVAEPVDAESLGARLEAALGRAPLWVEGGPARIRRIGWCTGAAQGFIDQAAGLGLDAYISGEVSEQTVHVAREAGIHYFAAGHHATERDGARALGGRLADVFKLQHAFIDVDNPA
ncbi:Nif3-like dinuclear metal center hexameric protein [Thioalkalivibrio denitrificans]|uniref:GTP cyclohydrolase 1 type 2 homolog n=1 Tax=Thioalkalivibrio denitrificans TaxID=108003 RepID=A0A1V3NNN5_9GAMM|nr:Nif3-like dinuclear metal center hexameric protein [Thioalkalivibrio denitrificans]OOG26478.1 Nif3-like dinuclear metal center hexameric protein [Thioalkalivibrio denitrificans]